MTDYTVAETILKQLGGNVFCMMVGATKRDDRIASENALIVRIRGAQTGSNKKGKPTYMKVELNGMDLYDVTFYRVQLATLDLIETGKHEGIYADMLRPTFTEETGLYTSM